MTRRRFLAAVPAVVAAGCRPRPIREPADGMPRGFWDNPQPGANFFNERSADHPFAAAMTFGSTWARLTPTRWRDHAGRDFLIGDADGEGSLVDADVRRLVGVLNDAAAAGLRVLLVPLSLPGSRWRQHHGSDDLRLWTDFAWHERAARLWGRLAAALHGHPAIAGYELLNEPHPERLTGHDLEGVGDLEAWFSTVRDGPADLNRFYERCIAAIRRVDATVPIVVGSGMYSAPAAFENLRPIRDPNTLYTLHVYEPYGFVNWQQNSGRWRYPGPNPATPDEVVDAAWLARHVEPVAHWQQQHGIDSNRVIVGEFGCHRRCPGAARYLADVADLAIQNRWHWAFYAFREDTWPGMDYEVDPGPLPEQAWARLERGQPPGRGSTAAFDALIRAARRTSALSPRRG